MRSKEWNKVAIMRYVWNFTLDTNRTFLVDWIVKNKLKWISLWEVKANLDSVLLWRKILNLRSLVKDKVKKITGNGERIILWHDNWHPKGPFTKAYSSHLIYDTRMSNQAKVKEIIKERRWYWPPTNSLWLLEIKEFVLIDL